MNLCFQRVLTILLIRLIIVFFLLQYMCIPNLGITDPKVENTKQRTRVLLCIVLIVRKVKITHDLRSYCTVNVNSLLHYRKMLNMCIHCLLVLYYRILNCIMHSLLNVSSSSSHRPDKEKRRRRRGKRKSQNADKGK